MKIGNISVEGFEFTVQEHLKQMGFRLNKDVTEEERQRRKEEWKNLQIIRKKPHRG